MASVHIANYVDMAYMFNISYGVGKSRPNHRLDVMLIQFLLSNARNEIGTSSRRIVPPELASELFKIDGICGPKTLRYISYYQEFRNTHTQHSGKNEIDVRIKVATDGAIDPWKYPVMLNMVHSKGTLLDRTSTLAALSYDAAQNQDFQMGIFTGMPPELKRVLLAH